MVDKNREQEIASSWTANAGAWTQAVRAALIPSRVAGTDQAILDAVDQRRPRSVLDVGCGEGWLTRALSAKGYDVSGTDGSQPLIERACELGGPRYLLLPYDAIVADPASVGGPWDVVVLNFALFAEHIAPLLAALASRLRPGGALIVQTLHPWSAAGEPGYVDGWRVATFAGFGGPFPEPMPWYYRTLAAWMREIAGAGLVVSDLREPRHPETGEPLSLLLTLSRAG